MRAARRPPGPGPGARRHPGLPLGPRRGDHRRGPVPGRHDRHGLRARAWSRAGVVATLKHFAGYSASRAGRNLAPVVDRAAGSSPTCMLPPFEMALRDGGARSVMHSYAEIDGVPVAADHDLLTGLLRDDVGLHRHRRRRLLRASRSCRRLHGVAADAGRRRRAGAARRHRRRAAHRATASARRWSTAVAGRRGRRGAGRPRAARGCCSRRASWACSTRTGGRAAGADRGDEPATRRRRRAGTLRRARWPAESVVLLRNDGALPLRPGPAGRAGRARRRRPDGDARLLLLPQPRRRAPPRRTGSASRCRRCSTRSRRVGPAVSYAPGCAVTDGDTLGHRRGGRRRPRRPTSCVLARRRPGRAVRPRHLRRGLRRRPTCGCPACRRELVEARAGHRHAGRRWCC